MCIFQCPLCSPCPLSIPLFQCLLNLPVFNTFCFHVFSLPFFHTFVQYLFVHAFYVLLLKWPCQAATQTSQRRLPMSVCKKLSTSPKQRTFHGSASTSDFLISCCTCAINILHMTSKPYGSATASYGYFFLFVSYTGKDNFWCYLTGHLLDPFGAS